MSEGMAVARRESIHHTMEEIFKENDDAAALSKRHNLLFSYSKERDRTQREHLLSSLLTLSPLSKQTRYALNKEEILAIELLKLLLNRVIELKSWAFLEPFPRANIPTEDISKFKVTMEKLNSFPTSKNLSYAGPLVRSLSPLFPLCSPFIRSLLLLKIREYSKSLHEEVQKLNIDKLLDQTIKFTPNQSTNSNNTPTNDNNNTNNINNNNNNNQLSKDRALEYQRRLKKMNDGMEASYVKYFTPILRLLFITISYLFYFLINDSEKSQKRIQRGPKSKKLLDEKNKSNNNRNDSAKSDNNNNNIDNSVNSNQNNENNVNKDNYKEITNEEIAMILDVMADLQFCKVPLNILVISAITQYFINESKKKGHKESAFDTIFNQYPFPDAFPERPSNSRASSQWDDRLYNRSEFYLQLVSGLISAKLFSDDQIFHLIPLLSWYIKTIPGKINAQSHSLFRVILVEYGDSFAPSFALPYIQTSVDSHPEFTSVESILLSMQILIDYYPSVLHLDDIAINSINIVAQKIGEQQSHQKNSIIILTLALFHTITFCELSLLPHLLAVIERIVEEAKGEVQRAMCKYLSLTILKNFDLTRKNMCVGWYLALLQSLNLNHPTEISALSSPLLPSSSPFPSKL